MSATVLRLRRGDDDAAAGIANDDEDEVHDVELWALPAANEALRNRPTSAKPSRPQSAANASVGSSARRSWKAMSQESLRHTLGTADVSPVAAATPPTPFFVNFGYGSISSFLASQKREQFGVYGEKITQFLKERRRDELLPMPSILSPQEFAVEQRRIAAAKAAATQRRLDPHGEDAQEHRSAAEAVTANRLSKAPGSASLAKKIAEVYRGRPYSGGSQRRRPQSSENAIGTLIHEGTAAAHEPLDSVGIRRNGNAKCGPVALRHWT
jgi:hypothetical protein